MLLTEKTPRSENSPPRCRKSSSNLTASRTAAAETRAGFRDHDRDRDHGRSPRAGHQRCSVIMPGILITEHRTCRLRTESPRTENSPLTMPEKAPRSRSRVTRRPAGRLPRALLSKRTADSNREGHDAHASPAAPGRGNGVSPASTRRLTRATRQPPGQRRWSVIMPAAMITEINGRAALPGSPPGASDPRRLNL